MQQYMEQKTAEMKAYVMECEQRFGMTSEEFLAYYRELESHGLEEEYDWYIYLSYLGKR
ncbi:hypothetical protein OS242_17205 [Tumebacillus sp. DT12]|uniref:Uncharacterized protein n=1 Tax=Tumebacillus lacus TaxID=2995335 RepID=A0ABT3X458_9BACL|nr:hypothetical protein [Tumebacillus lacus]MCX7571683.1 hypothetical protein [Tumebacillus lacus]